MVVAIAWTRRRGLLRVYRVYCGCQPHSFIWVCAEAIVFTGFEGGVGNLPLIASCLVQTG